MNAATFCEHFDLLAEANNGVAKLRELSSSWPYKASSCRKIRMMSQRPSCS